MSKKHTATNQPIHGIVNIFNMFNVKLPKEFRLPNMIDVPSLNAVKARFNDLYAQLTKLKSMGHIIPKNLEPTPIVDKKELATIATNAWKAKVKMVDAETGEAKEDMKNLYRPVERIWESLEKMGIKIIDPKGKTYTQGLDLIVVSWEPAPDIFKDEIKETLKPHITLHGHTIQRGEVIVGTPQSASLHKGE